MASFKDVLLEAPDSQLDPEAISMIRTWDEPYPTALQVLHVLDFCVRYAWASGMVIKVLNFQLRDAISREATTYEQVVKQATWRDDFDL